MPDNKPAETPAPTPTPSFAPVPVATLAPATREISAETRALGEAIFGVIASGENAAQDPTTYTDRSAANKRAAALKRAVAATGKVPTDKTVGARVSQDGKVYRVAVLLSKPKPRKAKETPVATA